MDEKLITIIVPVYNIEEYLPRCIESILKQTYKKGSVKLQSLFIMPHLPPYKIPAGPWKYL